jgi:N-hydroxyarylamine O-acetyltransferase
MRSLITYFARIGYAGPVEPTLDVLRAVHRQHLLTIPYENLDIHLGRELSLDLDAIFDKLVTRRRGGWCYEMNALLAWALREIGFDVTFLGGTVGRDQRGDAAEGNHLVLLVRLDQPYLADAGFGNAFLDPLPLREGEHVQGLFRFRLERPPLPASPRWGKGFWIFHNHEYGGAGFDFTLAPRELADFAAQCRWLQTSPESGFVRVAVCHRLRPDGVVSLRGAVRQMVTAAGATERVIETEDYYRAVLRGDFDLDLGDDLPRLWAKVRAAHVAWMESQQT